MRISKVEKVFSFGLVLAVLEVSRIRTSFHAFSIGVLPDITLLCS